MKLGDLVPDFEAESTAGTIRIHDWIGGDWCLFVSHPKDFTPICTTELGSMAHHHHEFTKRGDGFQGYYDCFNQQTVVFLPSADLEKS